MATTTDPRPRPPSEGVLATPVTAPTAAPQAPPAPDPSDHLAVGVQVLRDLLHVEERPDRVRRVLRVWESKVATAVRGRDLNAAREWMRAVTGDPTLPPEHTEAIASAIATLSRPALIDDLLVWLVDHECLADAEGLFAEWGEPVARRMVELMAVDDPPVNRRYAVDVLAMVGRSDTRLLTSYVGDHRWFIVRNVAIALGRSGRLATIPVLRSLMRHEDARVRVEALRGVAAVDADAAVADLAGAFRDPDRRVRQVAISLLRACPSREVVLRLSQLVTSGAVGGLEAERLIEVIGERSDEGVDAALEDIASRRGRGTVSKAARQAAKRELARRAP
ncbi:MAG: HEAT repeat domain-containing protein [Actinobacteria bacterium]|nr:HEAT repeat domain-containing protein [Actinomycetota bacterium]